MVSETDMGNKYGLMVQSMKVSGLMIVVMEKVNLFMPMAMNMKVNGKMIRLTDKVYTIILMVLNTLEWFNIISIYISGLMINSMEKV